MVNEKPQYTDLIEEIESSRGYEIIHELESLKATHYIFKKNHEDLIKKITEYENDIKIWSVKNRPLLHQVQLEILRLLHNYTSSILTLIDHTRNFRKGIKEKKLDKDFEFEIKKLGINDVVTFMKQLRQYFQHYKLPITNAHLSVKKLNENEMNYATELRMELDVRKLLEWKRWNNTSKRYLGKFDGNVEIKVFCQEYYTLINNFYEWFYNIVIKAYQPEIRELAILEERINKLYPPPSKIN